MRRSYGYSPGGAPRVSPAQARRIDEHTDWERKGQNLAAQACDLLLAGRVAEFGEFEPLITAHREAEPQW